VHSGMVAQAEDWVFGKQDWDTGRDEDTNVAMDGDQDKQGDEVDRAKKRNYKEER